METQQTSPPEYDPASGCLLRVFWMMIGNVLLVFCAYAIFQNRQSLLGVADAFFWATAVSLLAARYTDIRYLRGRTADGNPASLVHWRRYAATVLVASAILWFFAHAAALFWQTPSS
jgi:hypothetical protein